MTKARGRPRGSTRVATRDALLDAAEELMLEAGYAAVSSRRIAAKTGTDAALVFHYFGTMDDLFIALFRRRAKHGQARQLEALSSPQPLWALWDAARDQPSGALTQEFVALANHRKAIRTEISRSSRRLRRLQLEHLTGVLDGYGVDATSWPPASIILMLSGIARYLITEEAFDVDIGHAETIALVERHIRAVEGERRA